MTTNRRHFSLATLGALAALSNPHRAFAQGADKAWPTKQVRMTVGFPAGSSPDLIARTVSEPLAKALGQTVIVDNKPGASGNIAANEVAKATDDHTIGVVINGTLTTAKALYRNLPFDPLRDFSMISLLATSPLLLVASNDLPEGAAFIDKARASGDQWSYGSVGTGSTGHLGMEYLKTKIPGLNAVHVPFQGNPQVVTALLGGQIQLALVPPVVAMAQVKAGKLKAIGVASERSPLVPGVPSLSDLGVKDVQLEVWMGLVGPARLSAAAKSRLSSEVMRIMQNPETRQSLFTQSFTAVGSSSQDFEARVKRETVAMGEVIKAVGVTLD